MRTSTLNLLAAVAAGLFFNVSARAEEFSCPVIQTIDLHTMLLPPPCDACDSTKADLADLQRLQQTRTPAMVDHASKDFKRTLERFLAGMNVQISASSLATVDPLFKCAAKITEETVGKAKKEFDRTRPYKLPGNDLHVLKTITADDDPSYPSAHAAFGAVTGLILAEMDPDLQDKFAARIEDFGMSRLVSGVHYRTDVLAGEISGATIAAQLLANASFRQELEKVKPSLQKALVD